MRPIPKDPRWKNNFKNAGQIVEKYGESMLISVDMNMYVSKSCAAIFGEFLKSWRGWKIEIKNFLNNALGGWKIEILKNELGGWKIEIFLIMR